MNDNLKISIIVPVYNGEETILGSMESLFLQTLREIEIIAINDASTDRTSEILEQLSTTEPRLRVIHLQENVGVHEARVVGLKLSSAPYIGFMDADDFVQPKMFEVMLWACLNHDADISVCGINLCSPERRKIGRKLHFAKDKNEDQEVFEKFCRMEYGTGALWNKLYKRELLYKSALIKFRWRQDVSEDTLVNIGCFLEAKCIRLVSKQLYEYVENSKSATRSVDKATCFTRMLRAYAVALDVYAGYGSKVLDGITGLYARQLHYPAYRVKSHVELAGHEGALTEAVQLITEHYPIGLVSMLNTGIVETFESLSVLNSVGKINKNLRIAMSLITRKLFKCFASNFL